MIIHGGEDMKSKADILLHPVRMRIVQALLQEDMTVYQLINKLGDVPQATMYRQLKTLVDSDLVKVKEERAIKGAIEKVYGVIKEHTRISKEEFASLSSEEHLNYFTTYHTHLLREVQDYLMSKSPKDDYKMDGFSYGITPLYLSEDEKKDFFERYHALLKEFASKQPAADKKTITLATMFIPSTK